MELKSLFDLSDKIAIITGGGSGIGSAIAEGYAEYGATVAVIDNNGQKEVMQAYKNQ